MEPNNLSDGVGLHHVGDRLHQIVSSRPQAKAFQVHLKNGVVREEGISPLYLGEQI